MFFVPLFKDTNFFIFPKWLLFVEVPDDSGPDVFRSWLLRRDRDVPCRRNGGALRCRTWCRLLIHYRSYSFHFFRWVPRLFDCRKIRKRERFRRREQSVKRDSTMARRKRHADRSQNRRRSKSTFAKNAFPTTYLHLITSVTEGLIGRDRSRCLNTRDLGVANLIVRQYLRSGQRLLSKWFLVNCRREPRLPHAIPPCYYAWQLHTYTVFAQSTRAEYESRDLFLPWFIIL